MNPKTINIIYWIARIWAALMAAFYILEYAFSGDFPRGPFFPDPYLPGNPFSDLFLHQKQNPSGLI
jgi:hypothetical protein